MFSSTAEHRIICPTQLVRAEGEAIKLPCRLDPEVNLSGFTVDWRRDDLHAVVHSYRHRKDDPGPQLEQYRNRTTLNHEDLSRGILDLQISSVRLSDSGRFTCNVPKLRSSCSFSLTVGKKSDRTTTTGRSGLVTETPQQGNLGELLTKTSGNICSSEHSASVACSM